MFPHSNILRNIIMLSSNIKLCTRLSKLIAQIVLNCILQYDSKENLFFFSNVSYD